MEIQPNHWKLTAIGMALVIGTALVTGLVVASWYGPEHPDKQAQPAASPAVELPPRVALSDTSSATSPTVPPAASSPTTASDPTTAPAPKATGVPPKSATEACNQYAARQAGPSATTKDKTIEVVKDAAIGAVGGAAVGALGGAIADGGSGAGKGAAIGGLVGGGAGTLYGIYANRKNDEKYRTAYSSCMKNRGYTT